MRLIDADNAISVLEILADKCDSRVVWEQAIAVLKDVPTIKAYTIEDLRNAYRDGEDNECSYHWGIRKAEPWYMKDEVEK